MEMLASIVGENEPKVKFEPYAMNEPSKMLKLVQHDSKEGEDQPSPLLSFSASTRDPYSNNKDN